MALQVTRSAAEDLEQSMGEVFGPLRDCMDHEGVEVRKVVVRHTYTYMHTLHTCTIAKASCQCSLRQQARLWLRNLR